MKLYSIHRCKIITSAFAFAIVLTLAFIEPALAVDADWSATPGDGDFNNDANWVGGVEPDGVASFGASTNTNLSFSTNTTIGGITINSGTYTFGNGQELDFSGAGITISGGSAAITNNHILGFNNAATAGSSTI